MRKLLRVRRPKPESGKIGAYLRIAGHALRDAGIEAGDYVTVEAVGKGELRVLKMDRGRDQ